MQEKLKQTETPDDEDESPLTISPEKVCFIIMKAKEFDAKDEVTEPDRDQILRMTWMLKFLRTTKTIPSSRSLHR
jgi:hypothetical protein